MHLNPQIISQQLTPPFPVSTLVVSVASTLLLHSPSREVIRVLSPVPLSGPSVSAGRWLFKAWAPQCSPSSWDPLAGATLWKWSLSAWQAESLGRVADSLGAFFLLMIFLPCKEGGMPGHNGDHSVGTSLKCRDRASAWSHREAACDLSCSLKGLRGLGPRVPGPPLPVLRRSAYFQDVGEQLWILLDLGAEDTGELHLLLLCEGSRDCPTKSEKFLEG